MTEGASQGLFVVIAIVIFGIFIGLSYIVFGENSALQVGMVDMFESAALIADGSVHSEELEVIDEEGPLAVLPAPDMPEIMNIIDYEDSKIEYVFNTSGNTAFAIGSKQGETVSTINLPNFVVKDGITYQSYGARRINGVNDIYYQQASATNYDSFNDVESYGVIYNRIISNSFSSLMFEHSTISNKVDTYILDIESVSSSQINGEISISNFVFSERNKQAITFKIKTLENVYITRERYNFITQKLEQDIKNIESDIVMLQEMKDELEEDDNYREYIEEELSYKIGELEVLKLGTRGIFYAESQTVIRDLKTGEIIEVLEAPNK